jgi:ATP-binding cassette, subfamily B, heavy metal transporter
MGGSSSRNYAPLSSSEGGTPSTGQRGPRGHTNLTINDASADSDNAKKPSTMKLGWRTMKLIAPYYWPAGETELKFRVVLTLAIIVIGKVINLFVPQMYQGVVDSASAGTVAGGFIFGYGMLRLLSGSARDLRETIFLKVQNAVARRVALDAFWHLSELSLNFHLTRNTGALMRTMDRGKAAVGTMLTMVGFSILPLFLELILTCAILVPYGWSYSVITLVTITGYVAFTLAITEWRTKFRRGMNDKDNETSNKALDSMLNYETVKYFTAEEAVINRYDESLSGYFAMVLKTQLSLALLNFGQAVIITAGLALSMGLSAQAVADGTLTIGQLVAINSYILQLYIPLNWLGTSYRMIVNAITDLEKLFDLFDEHSDVTDPDNPVTLRISDKQSASVEFRNVSFSYPKRGESDSVPVLNGLSFTVPAGHTVALVGPSGSGKTTIGRLLCRFYDPSDGSVLIGDTNIKAVTQTDLRSHIGVVPQDTVLFNETLRYNVEFGSIGAVDSDKVHMSPEEASEEAALGPFISSLPDGWETGSFLGVGF